MIDGRTQLVGLIGWPVRHSFSPAMHNAAAKAAHVNLVYVPMPVHPEDIATAVSALPTLGFRGVNVTIPHKQAVMPLLDEIDPAAAAIGAVNTIVVEIERLETGDYKTIGFNTDWSGFLADLAALGVLVKGRDCLVLGAGGSARAVVYGLLSVDARVQVFARRVEQAQQLVSDLEIGFLKARSFAELATAVSTTTTPLIITAYGKDTAVRQRHRFRPG